MRSVCPPAPTLTGAQSGFAVSGIRYVFLEEFRKLSLPQTVCVMIWGSALCLTCQQEGSIKIRIDCAVVGEPEHFQGSLPHRCSCPSAAFNTQLHMAGALMGASSLLRRVPQFLFQLLSSDCLWKGDVWGERKASRRPQHNGSCWSRWVTASGKHWTKGPRSGWAPSHQ